MFAFSIQIINGGIKGPMALDENPKFQPCLCVYSMESSIPDIIIIRNPVLSTFKIRNATVDLIEIGEFCKKIHREPGNRMSTLQFT